jgi:cytochrome c biogenesis protein CcdA
VGQGIDLPMKETTSLPWSIAMILFISSLIVLGVVGSFFGLGSAVSGIGQFLWSIIEFVLEYAAIFIIVGIVIGFSLHWFISK